MTNTKPLIRLFCRKIPPTRYIAIYNGEELSAGKIFHRVKIETDKDFEFKFFKTKKSAEVYAKKLNEPFEKSYMEWLAWVEKNPDHLRGSIL